MALLLTAVLASLVVIPNATIASSCADPGYSPTSWGPPSTPTNFTFGIGVAVRYTEFIREFDVKYNWDGTTYDLGGGGVLAPFGGAITFHSTEVLASKTGNYSISGKYNGTVIAPDGTSTTFKCRYGPLPFEVLSFQPYVRPIVTVTANPTWGIVPLDVAFNASVSGGLTPFTYAWSFGDGGSGSGPAPTHTYTVPSTTGTYTASVTVTDSKANSTTGTVDITATAPLQVSASANRTSGTVPLTVTLSASARYGLAPYTYSWTFGDGGMGTGAVVGYTYASTGTFEATVTAKDSSPTPQSATGSVSISVSALTALQVTAAAEPTSGTAPATIAFSATASGGAAPYSFSWAFGDGGTAYIQNPTHTYETAGTYNAAVDVRDANGAVQVATTTVSVDAPGAALSAAAAASVTSGTVPFSVDFTGSAIGGAAPYTFAWDFGDGGTSSVQNPVHTYTVAGTYNVTLTVADASGGTVTRSLSVTANPASVAPASPASSSSLGYGFIGAAVIGVAIAACLIVWRLTVTRRASRRRKGPEPPSDPPHR